MTPPHTPSPHPPSLQPSLQPCFPRSPSPSRQHVVSKTIRIHMQQECSESVWEWRTALYKSDRLQLSTFFIGEVDVDSVIIQQQTDNALVTLQTCHRQWGGLWRENKGHQHMKLPCGLKRKKDPPKKIKKDTNLWNYLVVCKKKKTTKKKNTLT